MKNKQGFSLIEVLVFVGVLSIFFVFAASITATSLRNMKISEHKILATRYAEEGIEWLRNQKENDWNAFTNVVNNPSPPSNPYCMNTLSWPLTQAPCSQPGLNPPIFRREVRFTRIPDTPNPFQIHIAETVSWDESGGSQSVVTESDFTIFE